MVVDRRGEAVRGGVGGSTPRPGRGFRQHSFPWRGHSQTMNIISE